MRELRVAAACLLAVAALAGCGGRGPVPVLHEGLHTASAEITVADAVAAAGGYGSGAVEVLVSRTQLRIVISDRTLAMADPGTRAAAAAAAAAAAEKALASDPEFPSIHAISIAIVHPPGLGSGMLTSHTEDVVEFRRGADGRFALPRG